MSAVVARNPLRRNAVYLYMQRAAHERPAIFWSFVLGVAGPVMLVVVPPVRRKYFGYKRPEPVPTSYPVPNRPRDKELSGYDDE